MNGEVNTRWTVPASPDPNVIFGEAKEDARNGYYALALTKYCWYFDHALEYDPLQAARRLSFALHCWYALGTKYPPAMAELRAARDRAAQNALAEIDVCQSFHDSQAIDRVLGDEVATRELFIKLHESDRWQARAVYHLAQPVLVAFGEYGLCSEYLDAEKAIDLIIQVFHQFSHDWPAEPQVIANQRRERAANGFRNDSAQVIALLTVAGRRDDAQRLAERIINVWDDASVRDVIKRALRGEFPPQE